jgi:hypothetical protein
LNCLYGGKDPGFVQFVGSRRWSKMLKHTVGLIPVTIVGKAGVMIMEATLEQIPALGCLRG